MVSENTNAAAIMIGERRRSWSPPTTAWSDRGRVGLMLSSRARHWRLPN